MIIILHAHWEGGTLVPVTANRPLDASELARSFRKGAKVEPAISRVLASLARLGHVHTSDGKTFTLRRAA